MKKMTNLKFILFGIVFLKVMGLLYKIITTRMIGFEGMKILTMIIPLLSLSLTTSSLSLQSVCNQNICNTLRNKSIRVILFSALKITIVSSSIISIIMLLSFPIYKYIYNDTSIYIPMLLCIPIIYSSNISGIMKGYLEADNQFNIPYASNILESSVKFIFAIILLLIFKNANANIKIIIVFFTMMLSEISSCLYLAIKIKKKHKISYVKTNKYEHTMLKQAIPLTLSNLIQAITSYIAPFIFYYAVKKCGISADEAQGYYTMITGYAIPLLIFGQFGVITISKFAFPMITKSINNKNNLNITLEKSFFISFSISFFCFILCYYQPQKLLYLMYKTTMSAEIVHFLSPLFFIIYFDPLFISILQSYKKEKVIFRVTLESNILMLLCIYLLSKNSFFNTFGYVIGLAISYLFKCIIFFIYSLKETGYNPLNKSLIYLITISTIYFILAKNLSFVMLVILSLFYMALCFLYFYYRYIHTNNLKTSTHKEFFSI